MTAPSQGQTAKDQTTERESALIARLVTAGYVRAEPSILQPASVFLDQSGEDIRGRIYLTTDASGAEYCLRPEYTIPVCRDYLASSIAGKPAAFSYLGPVFRYRPAGPVEFNQAGLESFGRSDREAADAEIFTVALEAARAAHAGPLTVRIGDTGLFTRLLDILDLPPVWLRRIRRGHARGQTLDALFALPENGNGGDHSGVLAALEGTDKKGARALVEDLLSIAGISSVSGRTAGEIAERFLEQASLKAGSALAAEKRVVIERYLTIAGNPDDAARQLRALADDTKLDLTAALDAFEARLGFIAARGFDVGDLQFSARFGRNLDYYTGFVFEAQDRSRTDNRPIVGGGRYDGLLKTLGASADIPAVGAAIWCDRLDVVGASA
ncbi:MULTISPECIES: ATP phosphoribosyltransferase regulatory subunit [unclassified Beijerinckia]|uniref:ATP phosphoribosyltransferase regulatory subunit n=1 Tax=unclassified Beijerinckia TaxID=2638183 RepID=UPI00089D978E|nr:MULTISPECIES: ATP phosphoribosyltransferase regulatory subunit [unclassified Beijerinckia]MDH7796551.1 ATP phosphoribosyltransferase regulatory subunit [Beijerinckia sp. GAS462]SEC49885.1 ATP phosphoribosyltransferase regulatory subunit [Beijerinckia sp. 28-YEA-48]